MKINELAKLCHVSKESIRYYESLGLLNPTRSLNGYREYRESDVDDLMFILNLKKLNLTLEDISILIAIKNKETSLSCKKETVLFLETHITTITNQLQFMEKSLNTLKEIHSIISTSNGINDEEKVIPLLKKFEGDSLWNDFYN